MQAKRRVFLDANVVFSAFYAPSGRCGLILQAHLNGQITVVVSRQVLDEIIQTMQNKRPDLIGLLSVMLRESPFEVQPDPSLEAISDCAAYIDPKDAPILAAAMAASPDVLVTGNTRHFTSEVAIRSGLHILTPAAFVDEFMRPPA
jgi:putative PIN family toxin of toxin-antitoxin system